MISAASSSRCSVVRRRGRLRRAQQRENMRRIGLLMASVETDPIGQERVEALRRGLREFGWVERPCPDWRL